MSKVPPGLAAKITTNAVRGLVIAIRESTQAQRCLAISVAAILAQKEELSLQQMGEMQEHLEAAEKYSRNALEMMESLEGAFGAD